MEGEDINKRSCSYNTAEEEEIASGSGDAPALGNDTLVSIVNTLINRTATAAIAASNDKCRLFKFDSCIKEAVKTASAENMEQHVTAKLQDYLNEHLIEIHTKLSSAMLAFYIDEKKKHKESVTTVLVDEIARKSSTVARGMIEKAVKPRAGKSERVKSDDAECNPPKNKSNKKVRSQPNDTECPTTPPKNMSNGVKKIRSQSNETIFKQMLLSREQYAVQQWQRCKELEDIHDKSVDINEQYVLENLEVNDEGVPFIHDGIGLNSNRNKANDPTVLESYIVDAVYSTLIQQKNENLCKAFQNAVNHPEKKSLAKFSRTHLLKNMHAAEFLTVAYDLTVKDEHKSDLLFKLFKTASDTAQTSKTRTTLNEVILLGADPMVALARACMNHLYDGTVIRPDQSTILPLSLYLKTAAACSQGLLFYHWKVPTRYTNILLTAEDIVGTGKKYGQHLAKMGLQKWGKLKDGQEVYPYVFLDKTIEKDTIFLSLCHYDGEKMVGMVKKEFHRLQPHEMSNDEYLVISDSEGEELDTEEEESTRRRQEEFVRQETEDQDARQTETTRNDEGENRRQECQKEAEHQEAEDENGEDHQLKRHPENTDEVRLQKEVECQEEEPQQEYQEVEEEVNRAVTDILAMLHLPHVSPIRERENDEEEKQQPSPKRLRPCTPPYNLGKCPYKLLKQTGDADVSSPRRSITPEKRSRDKQEENRREAEEAYRRQEEEEEEMKQQAFCRQDEVECQDHSRQEGVECQELSRQEAVKHQESRGQEEVECQPPEEQQEEVDTAVANLLADVSTPISSDDEEVMEKTNEGNAAWVAKDDEEPSTKRAKKLNKKQETDGDDDSSDDDEPDEKRQSSEASDSASSSSSSSSSGSSSSEEEEKDEQQFTETKKQEQVGDQQKPSTSAIPTRSEVMHSGVQQKTSTSAGPEEGHSTSRSQGGGKKKLLKKKRTSNKSPATSSDSEGDDDNKSIEKKQQEPTPSTSTAVPPTRPEPTPSTSTAVSPTRPVNFNDTTTTTATPTVIRSESQDSRHRSSRHRHQYFSSHYRNENSRPYQYYDHYYNDRRDDRRSPSRSDGRYRDRDSGEHYDRWRSSNYYPSDRGTFYKRVYTPHAAVTTPFGHEAEQTGMHYPRNTTEKEYYYNTVRKKTRPSLVTGRKR